MNYDSILSSYDANACVISIELYPNETYGNIQVVGGNQAFFDSMAALGHTFKAGSPYENYFPQNKNFEDYCFHCVYDRKPYHAYVELFTLGLWLNMFVIPLQSDTPGIGYCIFVYEMSQKVNTEAMVDLSNDVSSDVLKACIKLRGAEDPKKTFQEVTEDIRVICGSEHCCILLTNDETRSCTILGDALKKGTHMLPMTTYIDGFYDITLTWKSTLGGSTCIIIKDQYDMEQLHKQNPVWAESLKGAMVDTIVLYPLRFDNKLLGYMWALNFDVKNTIKIKKTLELTTFFLASEIASFNLVSKLEFLSSIDSLTGIKNRNEMNNCVDKIVKGEIPTPTAVLFIDLNGLKCVNDERGHSAGDKMLQTAAALLRETFHDGDVYRAGGDEFMITLPNISESEMQERIEQLNKDAMAKEIHFSVGTCYGGTEIRRAMRLADERMYIDKKAYYEQHPEAQYR